MWQEKIITETRKWLGTPYRHQACCLGVGADCLGLIRGVYAGLYGAEAPTPPAYPRFGARDEGEIIWQAARHYLQEKALCDLGVGDVLLFRLRAGQTARHLAIMSASDQIIHAASGAAICEVYFHPWWQKRLVACFSFPKNNINNV